MKFSASLLVASLASSALALVASPETRDIYLVERDLATFKTILSNVNDDINDLDAGVNAYTGGSADSIVNLANVLISTMDAGTTTANAQPTLSLSDSLGLQQPVKTVTASTKTLVDDLTNKRSLIISNNLCATTRGRVNAINTSANNLINAIVAKVPSDAQGIADMLVADLRAQLARAQTNFNTSNCP